MVTWASVVGTNTVNSYITLNGTRYLFKNTYAPAGDSYNRRGAPPAYQSSSFFGDSTYDEDREVIMRVLIFHALRNQTDYTDAQAAAWDDEALVITSGIGSFFGQNNTRWTAPAGVTGNTGIRLPTNSTAQRVVFFAVKDRTGHIRAWKIKDNVRSLLRTSAGFTSYYEQLSDSDIRERFGLTGGLTLADQTPSGARGTDSTALDAPTGGTGTTTMQVGTKGPSVVAETWTDRWDFIGDTQTRLNDQAIRLFSDPSTNKLHLLRKSIQAGPVFHVEDIDPDTGVISNRTTFNHGRIIQDVTCTPDGKWYIMGAGRIHRVQRGTTNTVTEVGRFSGNYRTMAAKSNTELYLVNFESEDIAGVSSPSSGAVIRAANAELVARGLFEFDHNNNFIPTPSFQMLLDEARAAGDTHLGSRVVANADARARQSLSTTVSVGTRVRLASLPITLNAAGTTATAGTRRRSSQIQFRGGFTGSTFYNGRFYAAFDFGFIMHADLTPARIAGIGFIAQGAGTNVTVHNRRLYSIGNVRDFQLRKLEPNSGKDFTFSNTLPTGLTYNSTPRTISIAQSVTTGIKKLIARVRDSATIVNEIIRNVDLNVLPRAVAGTYQAAFNFAVGRTNTVIRSNPMSEASGGVGAITYSLELFYRVNSANQLVERYPDVTMDEQRRLVFPRTMNPAPAGTRYIAQIRATWTSGTTTAHVDSYSNFSIFRRTRPPVRGNFDVANKELTLLPLQSGELTLEQATGGQGALTYTLENAPPGITLVGRLIQVSHTVPVGTYLMRAKAHWDRDLLSVFAESDFTITIKRPDRPIAGTFEGSFRRTQLLSNASTDITAPTARGGLGTLTYRLNSVRAQRYNLDITPFFTLTPGKLTAAQGTPYPFDPACPLQVNITAVWTLNSHTAEVTTTFCLSFFPPFVSATFLSSVTSIDLPVGLGVHSVQFPPVLENLREVTGYSYQMRGRPRGVTFDRDTRIMTVASDAAPGRYRIEYFGRRGPRRLRLYFVLTLSQVEIPTGEEAALPVVHDIALPEGSPTSFIMPEVHNPGVGTWTYSMENLPTGVTFNPNNRTLSFGRGTEDGVTIVTYKAVKGTETLDKTFEITINATDLPDPGPVDPTVDPSAPTGPTPLGSIILEDVTEKWKRGIKDNHQYTKCYIDGKYVRLIRRPK